MNQESSVDLAGKNVLVIDDDPESVEMLITHLQASGCRVITAATGDLGLRLARKLRPDLILLDLVLPRVSGVEVLQALKFDPELQAIPVIAVSYLAQSQQGLLLGEVDCLQKPVALDTFAAVLARRLQFGLGEVLVVDDDEADRDLLTRYLTEAGVTVRNAAGGEEALAMLESWTPDLVMLDLVMPGMDGIATLAGIRKDPRHATLPVAVVTGRELTAQELESLRVSVAAVLNKGDRAQTLETGLKRALGLLLESGKSRGA